MFESILAAWHSTMDVAKKVLDRVWGDQTSQEASLMTRAEQAKANYDAARGRLQRATDDENPHEKAIALSDLNRWRSELNRLRDEAAAKRLP